MDTFHQPPSEELGDSRPVPASPLYSSFQVGLAAFLGGPFAACWLLATNFAALGKPDARRQALLWGAVSTALLLALSFTLPAKFPQAVIPITYTVGLSQAARTYQGAAFAAHLAAGGRLGSYWRVVGVALSSLVVLVALGVAIGILLQGSLPK